MKDNEIISTAKKTIQREAQAVAGLAGQIGGAFVNASKLLLACKGHVLVTGAGTSHAVARRMAHLLTCSGTPALLLDAGDGPHGLSGAVPDMDVLVALSKGGPTDELVFLAKVARERGAKVISMTEAPDSELGRLSDVVLKVQSPPEADLLGMIATGSSLVHAAYGDALCAVLLEMRGQTVEGFGKTHPGGAVGNKLRDMDIIE